jgi:hypothetical protein
MPILYTIAKKLQLTVAFVQEKGATHLEEIIVAGEAQKSIIAFTQ